jgi:hypothetical protein
MNPPDSASKPLRRTDLRLALLAPVLMLAVAGTQIYLGMRHQLSAWKGGGFGMFSTYDSPGLRLVLIQLHGGGQVHPATVGGSSDLLKAVEQVRVFPRPAALAALAARLGDLSWALADSTSQAVPVRNAHQQARPLVVDRVTIEVWRLSYRSGDQQIRRTLLARSGS